MLPSSSSSHNNPLYVPVQRFPGGVCRGSLYCCSTSNSSDGSHHAPHSSSNKPLPPPQQLLFGCLVGHTLVLYESAAAYERGDGALQLWETVGNCALAEDKVKFRLVTKHSTNVVCACATPRDRRVWLEALQTGLEWSLLSNEDNLPEIAREKTAVVPSKPAAVKSFFRSSSSSNSHASCVVCGRSETTTTSAPQFTFMPVLGYETRQCVCGDCATAEGLLLHMQQIHALQRAAAREHLLIEECRTACWKIVAQEEQEKTNKNDPDSNNPEDSPSKREEEALENNNSGGSNSSGSAASDDWTKVSSTQPLDTYVHLESAALQTYLQSNEFQTLARQCVLLQSLPEAENCLERLDSLVSGRSVAADLKTQAFTVAASDMGTALQLLLEQAMTTTSSNSSTTGDNSSSCSDPNNTTVLRAVLDFLLELCTRDGGASLTSVAFFWPQLCHLHLRLLPPTNAAELRRCELLQDFLITVATQFSIHLALELVWSHTADLEESLSVGSAAASSGSSKTHHSHKNDATTATAASEETTAVAPHCRRRRYAVLQFLCELESLLFDFEDGWGGGSVSLGTLLPCPASAETVELLKRAAGNIRALRLRFANQDMNNDNENCQSQHQQLSHSARWERLARAQKSPTEQAEEKLRIARNADYFSCHIAFSKRLADIAEKLRFMEQVERAAFLEQELTLLNASGTMGGDPLNRVVVADRGRRHCHPLVRVVRVPPTEGHVFRSKERTPVLLLMEVIDERMIEEEEEEKGAAEPRRRNTEVTTSDAVAAGTKGKEDSVMVETTTDSPPPTSSNEKAPITGTDSSDATKAPNDDDGADEPGTMHRKNRDSNPPTPSSLEDALQGSKLSPTRKYHADLHILQMRAIMLALVPFSKSFLYQQYIFGASFLNYCSQSAQAV